MADSKPAPEPMRPNVQLFMQLSPNIAQMARATGLSRPCIYSVLDGQTKPRRDTVTRFNGYLKVLMGQRLRAAQQLTASKK